MNSIFRSEFTDATLPLLTREDLRREYVRTERMRKKVLDVNIWSSILNALLILVVLVIDWLKLILEGGNSTTTQIVYFVTIASFIAMCLAGIFLVDKEITGGECKKGCIYGLILGTVACFLPIVSILYHTRSVNIVLIISILVGIRAYCILKWVMVTNRVSKLKWIEGYPFEPELEYLRNSRQGMLGGFSEIIDKPFVSNQTNYEKIFDD